MQDCSCIICNKIFTALSIYHPYQKYCSIKCREKSQNKKSSLRKKKWAFENKSKVRESQDNWAKQNPEKRAIASSNYRRRNSDYYAEYVSLRKRHKEQAKPKWLDEFQLFWIEELYHLAKLRRKEVDHIVPIKHDLVCGLHVPWNLQLLSRSENARKSNKFDEDLIAIVKEKNV